MLLTQRAVTVLSAMLALSVAAIPSAWAKKPAKPKASTGAQPSAKPIRCGEETCAAAKPICCAHSGSQTCTTQADCPPGPTTIPYGCTARSDCPAGLCCAHASPTGPTFTTCTPAASCPQVSDKSFALPMCATEADCPQAPTGTKLVECGTLMYFSQKFCFYK